MAKWWDSYTAAELSAIGEALGLLHDLEFFDKRMAAELDSMVKQEIGASDSQMVDVIRTYRANINLLKRLDSEAVDLVKAMNSDSREED